MKFVLGLVALVFIGLAVYVYTGKDHKQPQEQTVHKTVKEETPSQEAVTSVEKKVSEKTKPVVQHTVEKESLKVQSSSSEVQNTSNSDGEIGKGLTLESIENADVSDEEKDIMIKDMVYFQGIHNPVSPTLSEEEIFKIIEQDLKDGVIKKNEGKK